MVYTGVRLVVNASQVSAPYHVGAKTSLATFNLGRPELTLGRRSMLSTGQECARTIAANASPALGCLGRYQMRAVSVNPTALIDGEVAARSEIRSPPSVHAA